MAAAALVLAAVSLLVSVLLYQHNLNQRGEAVRYICDIEYAFEEFVKAPPRLPRDGPAIRRLRALNCDRLVKRTAE